MEGIRKTKILKKLLKKDGIIIGVGAYDGISAKIIEYLGFDLVYVTGAGIAASVLGVPDIGLLTMSEMVRQARNIVTAVDLPVISDADTGYGNPINVMRTVREFEQAGICAIHIEDQEIPKKCGHLEGKKIVSKDEMVQKIRAAVEARSDPDFIIIARTDARAVYGLEDALDRGHVYVEAGADVIFIEAPESVEELEIIGKSFDVPILINRGGGKKTPWLSSSELQELGFKIVIFPGDAQRAAAKAMIEVLKVLKETGNTASIQDKMLSFEERFDLLGLPKYQELEKRFLALDFS